MTPITDIRVLQYQKWIEQEDSTKKLTPIEYVIQVRIADDITWHDVKVEHVTLGEKDD